MSVKRTSAHGLRPARRRRGAHRPRRPRAVDKDAGTDWSTEGYQGGQLGKDGVGIYVDADPGVDARSIADRHARAGLEGGDPRRRRPAPPKGIDGWDKVAGGTVTEQAQALQARNGDRHRYYLVWITELAPGAERVKISEIALFAPRAIRRA